MGMMSVPTGQGGIGLHSTRAHVVHIGYHKTASTWLQLHVFPNLSELRYGNLLMRHLGASSKTASGELFFTGAFGTLLRQVEPLPGGPLLLSDEGISGSLWDGYGGGPRNAEQLFRVLPRARILVVVRRQDEMLRSIHGQYVNEGGTRPLRDFIAGRELEGSRFSLRHLEYDHLVARYVELFGREHVWVAPYECLRAQARRFLDSLCEFLGTRLTVPVLQTRENQTLSKPALWLLRTWNRLFRVSRFNPNPPLGPLRGGRRARNLLQRRLDPTIRRVAWDPAHKREAALLAELATHFAQSNGRLQGFTPYSLAEWGYAMPKIAGAAPAANISLERGAAAVVEVKT